MSWSALFCVPRSSRNSGRQITPKGGLWRCDRHNGSAPTADITTETSWRAATRHLVPAHRLTATRKGLDTPSPRPVGSVRHLAFPRAEFLTPEGLRSRHLWTVRDPREDCMFALDTATHPSTATRTTRSGACPSCGAYGGSQHQFSCQPGKRIKQGPFRHAARDARNSTAIREYARIQEELTSGL
jgi:hypothetical protein